MTRRLKADERSGGATDYYRTPAWCVHSLQTFLSDWRWHGTAIDPCAGDGAIASAALSLPRKPNRWGEETSKLEWTEWDVDPKHERIQKRDGLKPEGYYGICVMNPPYSLAEEFVAAWRSRCRELWALLPLTFLGSVKREAFFSVLFPDSCLVLPNRPSFTGGGTNSVDYAWFGWGQSQQEYPYQARFCRLPIWPKEERK